MQKRRGHTMQQFHEQIRALRVAHGVDDDEDGHRVKVHVKEVLEALVCSCNDLFFIFINEP